MPAGFPNLTFSRPGTDETMLKAEENAWSDRSSAQRSQCWSAFNSAVLQSRGTEGAGPEIFGTTLRKASWMDLNGDFFPECITKGSRFTLGVWGLGSVCSTLLLCSQPFATVGNRSDMAVPLGSATKSGHFWRFQTLRNLVSRGRHGTSWHSKRVKSRSVCDRRKMAQYFCVVFRRWLPFSEAGAVLQTCRVACFLRIPMSGLRRVVTTCKFRVTLHALHFWHSTLYTLYITLRTLHFTDSNLHFTLDTSHFTP